MINIRSIDLPKILLKFFKTNHRYYIETNIYNFHKCNHKKSEKIF